MTVIAALRGALGRGDRGAAARRDQFFAVPRYEIEARHCAGCRVFPDRAALVADLPPGGTVAESGVAEGDFSAVILERCRPEALILVDAWEGERYGPALARVEARFAAELASGRVRLRRGLSLERIAEFADASLDWVYLDTDHSYATTIEELRLLDRKVRPGGVIAGHDYCAGSPISGIAYGVVSACHQFCVEAGWRYSRFALDPHGFFSFGLSREGEDAR